MKTREMVLLTLIALIFLGAGIGLIIISVPLIPFNYLLYYLEVMGSNTWLALIIQVFLVILALLLVAKGLKREKKASYLTQVGSFGEIRLSYSALEGLVRKACSPKEEIRNLKTKVLPRGNTLDILIRMSVFPDTNIPELIEELQEYVKNYLEDMTGFSISQVKIMVDEVSEQKG